MKQRHLAFSGALAMLTAVTLGAFGAHALRTRLTAPMLDVWHTAVVYQMAHALGLLVLAALTPHTASRWLGRAGTSLVMGIALFSGSLYLLALTGIKWLGAITPIGGAAFLLGWLFVALAFAGSESP